MLVNLVACAFRDVANERLDLCADYRRQYIRGAEAAIAVNDLGGSRLTTILTSRH